MTAARLMRAAHSRPRSLYGVPWGADGLNNQLLGNDGFGNAINRRGSFAIRCDHTGVLNSTTIYMKAGVEYSGGTGGTVRLRVETDDGSGLPSGSLVSAGATSTQSPTNTERMLTYPYDTPPSLTQGVVYHRVLDNVDASPAANWISVNELYHGNNVTPVQPGIADADLHAEVQVTAPPWVLDRTRTPIFLDTFADGHLQGQGYFSASSSSGQKQIAGANSAVRMKFTPVLAHTFQVAYFYGYRQSGTTKDLVAHVKDVGGADLATGTIPVASIPVGDPVSSPSSSAAWAGCKLSAAAHTTPSAAYSLEWWSPGETVPYITFPIQAAVPSGFGALISQAPNLFTEGWLEYTTDGGATWLTHLGDTEWKPMMYLA